MACVLRILIVLSVLSIAAANYIRIVEAGRYGKKYSVLQNGFKFCPPRRGMAFKCLAPPSVNKKGVIIEVNGKRKIERRRPYFSAGNYGFNVKAQPMPYGKIVIKCFGNRFSTQVKGMIMCSHRRGKKSTPRTMPKKKKMPSKPMKKTPPSMPISAPKGACLAVRGTDFVGRLKRGWVRTGGTGVTFRPRSKFGGTVPPSYSVLAYKFRVPVAAKYAIVVDMGTKHPTEHNDIWLRCDGGFRLYRHGKTKTVGGFVKVYHNKARRAKLGVTIDHEGWSISTRQTYFPGRTYTCYVGARSTMTTLYGIVGFPCHGKQCERWSNTWKSGLRKCNV